MGNKRRTPGKAKKDAMYSIQDHCDAIEAGLPLYLPEKGTVKRLPNGNYAYQPIGRSSIVWNTMISEELSHLLLALLLNDSSILDTSDFPTIPYTP